MSDVTQILSKIDTGDPQAADQLLPLVYSELRELAAAKMRHEPPDTTLPPTALVHEAYLRLVDGRGPHTWNSRGHFFAAAAEAMRRILIDNARRKRAARRGGDRNRQDLERVQPAAPAPGEDLLALDEALEKLSQTEPMKASVVKLRYFGGLSMEQVARSLDISLATANRYWSIARAWLYREVSKGERTN